MLNPIDAVISWVDGYDPAYQQKLRDFCLQQNVDQHVAVEPTRIQQCNEIYFCLHGLRRFAPWIRSIYLITNQQIPDVVKSFSGTPFGDKIKIVDQNELLAQCGVNNPIFNSISVEWLMWRIKGLSRHFIYLNDDFFIIRPVTPEHFFNQNRLVLRGNWKTQANKKISYTIKKYLCSLFGLPEPQPKTNSHRAWQEKSARLAGWNKQFYFLEHAPFALNSETFDEYLLHHPNCIQDNARYPFRHFNQISSIPLMTHLNIKQHRVVFDNQLAAIMVNGQTHSLQKIKQRLTRAKTSKQIAFVCMQSIDQASSGKRAYLLNWLQDVVY